VEQYGQKFYCYATRSSENSAKIISSLVMETLPIRSVADFGCAEGVWLAAWKSAGATDVQGVDGPWVDLARLQIDQGDFLSADLTQPINVGDRQFDLVQSLEVAEHLPASAAVTFVESLARHGKVILFSASPPGQGGENHINEREYSYWQALFAQCGYRMFDFLRPKLLGNPGVQVWYRYNTFLFVHENSVGDLPPDVVAEEIPANQPIPDVSPTLYRLRKMLVRQLSPRAQVWLARVKSAVAARRP
jgi:hypothetical protein